MTDEQEDHEGQRHRRHGEQERPLECVCERGDERGGGLRVERPNGMGLPRRASGLIEACSAGVKSRSRFSASNRALGRLGADDSRALAAHRGIEASANAGVAGDVGHDLGVGLHVDLDATTDGERPVADIDAHEVVTWCQVHGEPSALVEGRGRHDAIVFDELDEPAHRHWSTRRILRALHRTRRPGQDLAAHATGGARSAVGPAATAQRHRCDQHDQEHETHVPTTPGPTPGFRGPKTSLAAAAVASANRVETGLRREPCATARRLSGVRNCAILLLLVSLATGLSSCGDGSAGVSADLAGRTFISTSVVENGQPISLVAGTRIRLGFGASTLSVSAGCNTGGGDYTVEGGRLLVDAIAMTEMACDDDKMAQDDWLLALLGQHPAISLNGDRLTLRTANVTLELQDREIVDPDRPLVATVWRGTTIIDGQSASNLPGLGNVQLVFDTDGSVALATGCNTGGATYRVDGSTIVFGPLTLTEIACDEPLATIEAHVVAVLSGDATFTIEASSLTLMHGDVGLGLAAVR